MKRLGLAVALVAVAMVAPAVASADPTALCNGQACLKGHWYTSRVSVTWNLNGETNLAGCAPQTYTEDTNQSNLTPITPNLPPWTYCTTDVATHYAFITLELSSPIAAAIPSRPPDSAGWYNHPVGVTFQGSSFSGIASCTPPATYAGPVNGAATVAGSCTDNAGKTVGASLSLAFDNTPPSLAATATTGDHSVSLSWQAGGDIAPITAIAVTRSPGAGHAAADMVYDGTSSGYQDTNVQDGVPYTYTVTAVDQAGNVSTQTLTATPQAHLVAPLDSAHLASPPLLTWTPVRGATYYNVQLYRDGKKVLSAWPSKAQLQLRHSWRYHDRRYRLKPGRYRWLVWPGFGKRRSARYGHMIGSWTFVVAR